MLKAFLGLLLAFAKNFVLFQARRFAKRFRTE